MTNPFKYGAAIRLFRIPDLRLRGILTAVLIGVFALDASAQGVFLDPILHEAVRQELITLGANPGPTIEQDEMVGVGFVSFTNTSGLLRDVTGLEFATDLIELDLSANNILNIAPLASLTNLQVLSLALNGNTITPIWLSDYTPLAKLVNLQELDLAFNHVIEDISFLQDLTNITELDLSFNKIEDIGPLFNLTYLEKLYIGYNEVKNISSLRYLYSLDTLELVNNEITDITPLLDNIGLTVGDTVFLLDNALSANALCAGLSNLESKSINLDMVSNCAAFTEQHYIDAILGTATPNQATLAAMDLNADYLVNVADLILFNNGGTQTFVPNVTGQTLASAKNTLENSYNLNVGKQISVTPVVTNPPVIVLSQDPTGYALPEHSEVNLTVSIPPDPFDFLTKGKDLPRSRGRQHAEAYYRAIDPLSRRDTLAKWIAENGYGQPGGVEAETVFHSAADLDLGRHMYMRQDDGNIAYYVTNHDTVEDGWESPTNPLATVAMEFSPGPDGGDPFIKFYTYDLDGNRVLEINLDGRGDRYQPAMCMNCHGGTVPTSLDANGEYPDGGNTNSMFAPFDLDTFEYSTRNARYTRSAQEDEFKKFNQAVVVQLESLQGTLGPLQEQIDIVEGWYGGSGMPHDFDGSYVPVGWNTQSNLYLNVFAKSCRTCHLQQTDVASFTTHSKFSSKIELVEDHVFDRGIMPNSLKAFKDFWLSTSPSYSDLLSTYLFNEHGLTVQSPGYPTASINISGDQSTTGNPITLDAELSLFANDYQWDLLSKPAGSSLNNNSFSDRFGVSTSFTPDVRSGVNGDDYVIQLTITKGAQSDTTTSNLQIDPLTISFSSSVAPLFSSMGCTDCHTGSSPSGGMNLNISQVGVSGVYASVSARSNVNGPTNSLILLKPTQTGGQSHEGGNQMTVGSSSYNTIRDWIGEGAIQN